MNYRSFYGAPTWADLDKVLTPRQRRRGFRKTERDFLVGGEPASKNGPGLSGHPGRRRAQLEGRAS